MVKEERFIVYRDNRKPLMEFWGSVILGAIMLKQLNAIAEIIYQVAKNEDKELSELCGEGIFYMPELAFAYACGKAVMHETNTIFPNCNMRWKRELSLLAGEGPSDLVFELDNGFKIVIEFKMRDKMPKYLADIRKLEKLNTSQHAKMFCVLLDSFTNKLPDSRIDAIEKEAMPIKLTKLPGEGFPPFKTKQQWYKGDVSCTLAVWAVGEVLDLELI